jgi:hypothetical protein
MIAAIYAPQARRPSSTCPTPGKFRAPYCSLAGLAALLGLMVAPSPASEPAWVLWGQTDSWWPRRSFVLAFHTRGYLHRRDVSITGRVQFRPDALDSSWSSNSGAEHKLRVRAASVEAGIY